MLTATVLTAKTMSMSYPDKTILNSFCKDRLIFLSKKKNHHYCRKTWLIMTVRFVNFRANIKVIAARLNVLEG